LDKGYIAPEAALKKLRAAKGIGQTVYIYGATGYGKTELVKQYLSKRRYRYISCTEDAAGLLETAAQGG
jgi:LuxR family maltose regulon positive regulatory protein